MSPIGVFDSGFGGLTVLREFVDRLADYDYLYLGDNARTPYGTRSFETVYRYTLECVKWMLQQNCPLIILACNTASAKALRSIQQNDLEKISSSARVLGVIRPTTEVIGHYTTSNQIAVLATSGTVQSESYLIEIKKFFPNIKVIQEACPMWVPLIENGEHTGNGADYFVEKHIKNVLESNPKVDTLLLACTHYPLLKQKIQQYLPSSVKLISQGEIVAKSLQAYLENHPQIDAAISKNKKRLFYTTDSSEEFNKKAGVFFGEPVDSIHVSF
ncbi:MAG: glutamate racemase [Chitinophagaceae bacterium]